MRRPARYTSDLALVHGNVFTGNPSQKRAQAVAIKGNRIVAVGSDEGILALTGKATRVVDLGGRFICAGFNDAHAHLLGGGFALAQIDLRGLTSLEEMRGAIEAGAARAASGGWIQGRGWEETELPGGVYPPLALLDEASGGHPAFLYRIDGHTAWANTLAMKAAGIGPETANPPGGELVRDANGAPMGILKESAASLVERVIPRPGPAEQRAAVLTALAELRRQGITSVSDFSPTEGVRVYSELLQEGRLTARISVWGILSESVEEAEALRDHLLPENAYLRCTTLKGYLDGTLGARTAALKEPYADAPGERGLAQMGEEHLRRLIQRAHRAGFQVALHAIGDSAAHTALNALERLGPEGRLRRHRIEHAELVDPRDIPRFVSAGAVASMQPSQFLSDLRWLVGRLGRERAAEVFPWRRLTDSGARVIFGSDWPIEPLDPLRGLFAATSTLAAEGLPALGLRADAQLEPEEALAAYTLGPAWATFEENVKGSLIAGHLADLVVLSGDPTHLPVEEISAVEVDFTIFDGKVVYSREGAGPAPEG